MLQFDDVWFPTWKCQNFRKIFQNFWEIWWRGSYFSDFYENEGELEEDDDEIDYD